MLYTPSNRLLALGQRLTYYTPYIGPLLTIQPHGIASNNPANNISVSNLFLFFFYRDVNPRVIFPSFEEKFQKPQSLNPMEPRRSPPEPADANSRISPIFAYFHLPLDDPSTSLYFGLCTEYGVHLTNIAFVLPSLSVRYTLHAIHCSQKKEKQKVQSRPVNSSDLSSYSKTISTKYSVLRKDNIQHMYILHRAL